MRYLSVCSGIEAATVAWHPLGWEPAAFSEIEKFPSQVLAHHYPSVPNLGDITKITEADIRALGHIDIVVGGFPCQDLSVAGKRKGLKNEDGSVTRSGLFFQAMRIVRWSGARFCLLENVPGIYSSNGGRDFAAVVGEALGVGFDVPADGWANAGFAASDRGLFEWATLDAQFFGVPQRRRRMFALADFGDWTRRPPILLKPDSLQGHPAPRREKGPSVAALTASGVGTCGADDNQGQAGHLIGWPAEVAPTLNAAFGSKLGLEDQHIRGGAGCFVPVPFDTTQIMSVSDVSQTLDKSKTVAVAFDLAQITSATNRTRAEPGLPASTLAKGSRMHVVGEMAVRRLTPKECERLQGFPDDYTKLPGHSADGPRYKALGNSMAVPVMRWIGKRIQAVGAIPAMDCAA